MSDTSEIIEAMARAVLDLVDEDVPFNPMEFCTVAWDAAREFQIHKHLKTGICPTCGRRSVVRLGAEGREDNV